MATKKPTPEYLNQRQELDFSAIDSFMNAQPEAAQKEGKSGALRRVAGDGAVTVLKGAIGVPESLVGMADMVTGGRVGRALENQGGAVGFRPKEAKAALDEYYSPEQRAAFNDVQQADGAMGTLGAVVRNPSVIAHSIGESLPMIGMGGVIGRGAAAAIPRLSGAAAGAIGEGVVAAGSGVERVRQQTADGLLTPSQAAIGGASGALTGGLTMLGGKVAQKFGIQDVDTLLAGRADPEVQKGFARRVLEGAASEGLLEELPQSIQEQVAQNMALGKPLDEGVGQSAVLGAIAGGFMGGASNMAGRSRGDAIRATKVNGDGIASRAVNAGIEAQAAAVESADPVQDSVQPDPIMDFGARAGAIRQALSDPATRDQLRQNLGADAFSQAAYYADAAANPDANIPARTRENMLSVAEQLVSRAMETPVTPIPGTPAIAPSEYGPAGLLPAPEQYGTPQIGLDTAPTGTIRVDAAGNAAPEVRADEISSRQRAAEAEVLGKQTPRGAEWVPPAPVESAPQALAAPRALTYDAAPTGRMIAGTDGIKAETNADAINARQARSVQPGDILNPSGAPFKNLMAANLALKRAGAGHEVAPVDGGHVVRQVKEGAQTNAAVQAPDQGQAPRVEAAAPRAVEPAATGGVPAEGGSAVEAGGVTQAAPAFEPAAQAEGAAPISTPAAEPAPTKKPPKTRSHPPAVRGSGALAEVSKRLGGIGPGLLADLSDKVVRERVSKLGKKTTYQTYDNPAIPGVGPLFRNGGSADLSEIARVLEEAGYITAGTVENDPIGASQQAQDIIRAEMNQGGSTLRVGDADSIEAEAQRRAEMAMDAERDPWEDFMFAPDDMDLAGASDFDAETAELASRLAVEAESLGIDVDNLRAEFFDKSNHEWSQADYDKRLNEEFSAAISAARRTAEERDARAIGESDQGGGQAGADSASPRSDRADRPDQAVRPEQEGLTLSAQTAADLKAKTEREESAQQAERSARDAEQDRLKREAEGRDNKARADQTVDDFQLGQSADEQMSGIGDLFAPKADEPAAEPDAPKLTRAEAAKLLTWQDMGQSDGVKSHALNFYASQADADAKRGRMTMATVTYGDRSAKAWMVSGDDQKFGMLSQAKKRGMEIGMARAVSEGFVEAPAEAEAAPAPAPAARRQEPAPASKTPTVDRHMSVMSAVRAGAGSLDDYQTSFKAMEEGAESVKAELAAKTKDELLAAGGPYFRMRFKGETKPEIIRVFYKDLMSEYALGKDYRAGGWVMSNGGFAAMEKRDQAALKALVESQTAEDLKTYADELAARRAENAAEREAKKAALANPQTLSEFRAVINSHITEGKTRKEAFLMLTPEQRVKYDDLEAEGTREARDARKRALKTEVRTAGQSTGGEIIATKHTRDGYDLFVVQLSDRLSKEDYATVLASAKRMGGWYSSFRGNGALPGFQFKERDKAAAFLKLAGGDASEAQQQAEQRRDAFEDDRSQTAVERLTAMADKLADGAAEIESRDRKTNTARRARFASSALAGAAEMKAKAQTMRNLAAAIDSGAAKFLDGVRTKSQVDMLSGIVATAKNNELRAKYDTYAEQEKRKGEPPSAETADFADFPAFTAYRSDLASLARQMMEVEGTKKLGQQLMKVADDVSDAYIEFAKDPANLGKLSAFSIRRGDEVKSAIFASRDLAERAIKRSGLTGKAIVLAEKRGVNRIIMSPSEAINAGIWKGDGDKRITLTSDFGNELVQAIGRRGNKANSLAVPWQFQNAHDRRKALSRIGIETPSEFRAALREFIGQKEQAVSNKVKEMELAMVGRKNDGLDFFPTPAEVADQMVEAADIQPDMAVLEPSAGMGHIADRIAQDGTAPDVVEMAEDRRELLEEKGYELVGRDFMDLSGVQYDRIIMNPPFSNRRDAEHVRHAFTLLKPGGRIVAIMGEGVFFGSDKKAQDFRDWLDEVGGSSEKLAPGTFMDPSLPVNTGVSARMVVIDKPAGAAFSRAPSTNTKAFKDWFGDSKVVDANGEPLVVYHGTKADFSVFNKDQGGRAQYFGDGIYLSGDRAQASSYAGENDGASVMPAYASLKNPFIEGVSKFNGGRAFVATELRKDLIQKRYEKAGFDGVILARGWVIAFRPEQIKSAIGNNGQFDPKNPDIRFSAADQQASRAQPRAETERQAAAIAARWANAPEVIVVDSMQDEAIPAAVRAEDIRQKSQGATGEPEGFYLGGKVYVVASQMASPADVARVVMHEALGHAGLRGVFGTELAGILDQLNMTNAAKVRAKAEQYGLDFGKPADRRAAAEEVLAEMAQTAPTVGFARRAIAAVRTWLRKHIPGFGGMEFSDAELVRNFIAPARAWVEKGAGRAGGGVAFQRGTTGAVPETNAPGPTGDAQQGATQGKTLTESQEAATPPTDGFTRLYHSGSDPTKGGYFSEVPSGGVFDGMFALRDGWGNYGTGAKYFSDVPTEKVLTQRGLDYDLDGETVADALRKAMPRLSDEDFDVAWTAAVEDQAHKVDDDDLMRVFREESVGEASWEAQRIRGKVAKLLGFQAVEMDDENGTSVLIVAGTPLTRVLPNEQSAPGTDGVMFSRAKNAAFAAADAVERIIGAEPAMAGGVRRDHTAAQLAAMKNVGFHVEPQPLRERMAEIWKDAGKKLAQGLADQFAPIKELSQDAYMLMRLSKGASGAFETLLQGGKLKLSDGVYDFDPSKRGGVIESLLKPLQGEHHDFLRWVAANRAERLLAEGKENLFTLPDIQALKTLATGLAPFDYAVKTGPRAGTVTRDRALIYGDSLRVFNEYQNNVLDMAEQSGLIDPEARKLWEHEFYVPFYRIAENEGGFAGPHIRGAMVGQKAFEKLKGGDQKLNSDLLENTLMNWAHLLDAAAKNRAAKAALEAAVNIGIAVEVDATTAAQMAKSIGKKGGAVWFMDGGQQRHFLVDDPYVMTALTSLQYAGMKSPIMTALGSMKHVLTVGVTASPFFKVRNLIRDSVQVIAASPIGANPIKNVKDGWKLTNPKSDAYFRLLAGGGTIHFGTMMEGSEAKRVQALVESGVDANTILDSEEKWKALGRQVKGYWDRYNELGNRGEAVNRASLYDQLIRQGKSHAEASLLARDLMDFSMQGSFATVRFLSQVVPFFNARIQGMYKLGRAAKEDPKRMAAVIGVAALAGISLMAAYSDDEDWKKREDWDRNNYWWFKFAGTAFRIPKPFEIGAVATLAERTAEYLIDDEMTGERWRANFLKLLGDNLSMNPVPQAVKPLIDLYANKDSFSGRPIETMGMEKLKSEYRMKADTSMVARGASTALNSVTGLVGGEALSPVQIDHLLRGYFGWLGSFVVSVADIIARPATGQNDLPASDYWKMATGSLISETRGAPSRYVTQMYEQAKAMEEAYATHRELLKMGKTEDAAEFAADNADKLDGYKKVNKVKRSMSSLNAQIKMVERSTLTAQEKRGAIIKIRDQQDELAKSLN